MGWNDDDDTDDTDDTDETDGTGRGARRRGVGPGNPARAVARGDVELVAIMARMGEGDEAAAVTLYERYHGPIAAAVHRAARHRRGRIDPRDVDAVVMDVCFELATVAARWSPKGGALPWVWARHRVANVVDRFLGPWVEPLDDGRLAAVADVDDRLVEGAEPAADGSLLDALDRLVPDLASARLLAQALDEAAISPRDRELWFEYQYEKHSGNASPAATVAPVFGMREASVRQAARRARQRLLRLVATDDRFASLADLPLLA
jgi:DNA-directed RNA polymerase specialized sigma24 family protein